MPQTSRASESGLPCNPSVPISTPTLPIELISRVLSYSSQGTLASICRVSKALYRIASPVLWKHLVLSPWKVNQDEEGVLDEKKAQCGSMKTRQKNGKALRNDVITFSVYHHSPTWCKSHTRSTLKLPNVHTLHLYFSDIGFHDAYCKHGCRLLRNIAPEVVVFQTACARYFELDDLPYDLFSQTEELVCISAVSRASRPMLGVDIWVEQLFSLGKMVWIFQPEVFDPSKKYEFTSPTLAGYDYRENFVRLAVRLPNTRLTVVNSGMIHLYDEDCEKTTIEASQRQNELLVQKEVEESRPFLRDWSPERRKERLESIEFMDLDEFMEKEEWWKYLNADELEEWKVMIDDVEKRFGVEAETDPAVDKEVMDE